MRSKKIKEALDYCEQNGLTKVIFVVPFVLSLEDTLELEDESICKGIVLYHPAPEIKVKSTGEWLGCFINFSEWELPASRGTLVFIGSHLRLTRKMVTAVMRSGRFSIVCKIDGEFQRLMLHHFLLWRAGEKFHSYIYQLPHISILRKFLFWIAGMFFVKGLWYGLFKRDAMLNGVVVSKHYADEGVYEELLYRAKNQSSQEKINPIPGRVILVNAGLAAGGAERQIVNTLIGLRESKKFERITLLAEHIQQAPQLNFFLHELEGREIEVSQIRHVSSIVDDGLSSLSPYISEIADELPANIIEDILDLVEEFRERRPSIVHAWQDSTSIKVGIAAMIAGVPSIVLASRNVAPIHFTYYQDYMHPAYRALAVVDSIIFINNSNAGVESYTQWLGLQSERFDVVRNGVDLTNLKMVEDKKYLSYRRSLGIPDEALVVGSIFRFWSEKRPMLWLKSAKLMAERFNDVHFLIIGDGPMRNEMEIFVKNNGLSGRVHLPGVRSDIATPLSAMNIFLLTSEFEGMPNVLLEAQWLGLPVISTNAGGAREAFDQGVTGWIVDDPNPESVCEELTKIIEHPELIDGIEKKGPTFVAGSYGIHDMVENTIKLYERKPNSLRSVIFLI
jgi:glycosyltransferase involved in cell wall biosynthesis